METVKIKVPSDIKQRMDRFSNVDWSRLFLTVVSEELNRLALLELTNKVLENSKFTDKDADRIAEKVKTDGLKKLKSMSMI